MIQTLWENLMLFHYGDCKKKIEELEKELKIVLREKSKLFVHDLELENNRLMTRVEESKAIYHYQTSELEKKITTLELELESRKFTMNNQHQLIGDLTALVQKSDQEIENKDKLIEDLQKQVKICQNLMPVNNSFSKSTNKKKK